MGVGGSVRAAAAFAFAVALRMRAAGRGGSEDEVEEMDEAEDEEEVVDAGWAVMRAGLWAAASAAATAGRIEGMSSGCRSGAGGLGGPGRDLAAQRADLVGSGEGGRGGAVAFFFRAWLGRGPAMCEVVWVGVRWGEQFAWAAFRGQGGVGLGLLGCAGGACAGHWVGWACRGARGSSQRVCAGSRVWGVVRGVRRVGVWRACAGVRAGRGGPCRGARGCTRWWACVGLRVSSEREGAWAGIVRLGVLCRCMCPLAGARLRGPL